MDATETLFCAGCCGYRGIVLFEREVYCTDCHGIVCDWVQVALPFGKHKGRLIHQMRSPEEMRYLAWFADNITSLSTSQLAALLVQIGRIARVYRSPIPQAWWAELLDLSTHFSKSEIKSSYRLLSKRLHPDMGGSTEEMQRLNEARSIADNIATY